MSNIVAIVGRPNVGKSTLFNRLIERKQAIMDNESGVTRDRHYGMAEWNGKTFTVIDTGGYVEGSEDVFEEAIRKQVKSALAEASVILFMVDVDTGLHGLDQDFANVLREIDKPIVLVANKSDNPTREMGAHEFYALGMESEIYPISSVSGSGTGDLLDEVVRHFPDDKAELPEEKDIPRIAILGRPNAGKSSFLNVLVGEERSIVTDVAGTTRDAIDTHYTLFEKDFILTDTAGIRRKSKVKENIEFYSVLRAIQALQDSDVCIIMIDTEQGIAAQDLHLLALADKYRKGCLIMMNKWDLIEKDTNTAEKVKKKLKEQLGPMAYIPVLFTSIPKKQRVFQTIEKALEIVENRKRRIPTRKLNDLLLPEIEKTPPAAVRGKYIKIKYITQLPSKTPTFAFFSNHPKDVKEAYQRFLVNKIRSHFNFEGVSVKVVLRKK